MVRVIQISGLFDRVQADFLQHSIRDAEHEHAAALVIQLSSSRAIADDVLDGADVPVAIWVGPGKSARVAPSVAPVLALADVVGAAPGAHVPAGTHVDLRSPTLGDFIIGLDGHAGITIPTKVVHPKGEKTPHREPVITVRFAKPSLTARTIHGVTSPGPAYALFVFGLLLALLEFATAGVGLAAATAAIFLALGALGLGGLPLHGVGVGLLTFGVFGFAIDVQAGAPRAWTVIGSVCFLAGSIDLYRDGMSVPLPWLIGVVGLTAAFVLAGLPSLIRARFSSPTIGRESFIGELGTAVGELAPDGVVSVRGGTWRARTNRATPIPEGGAIRVIGIDGLVLDVEPEEGGAKDYRERSKSST
ncbi:MAG TPA: NfeD family protein [Acidimicrobiales bacterium]|nr:NfeD family protein [Acidimicrobiales bacterium]